MDKSVSLLFCGDVLISSKIANDSMSPELQSIFDRCDVVCVNLEAPITTVRDKIKKAGPCLLQGEECASLLKSWGVTLVNCANNHIMDYGERALIESLKNLSEFIVIGAGPNFEEAFKLKKVIVGNIVLGFLSFAEGGYGMIDNDSYTQAGYAWINHNYTNELVKKSASECDYLFVQVHAGVEEIEIPLPEWRSRYKELIDLGASAIICTHPHVPQGIEIYKDAPIFYSLGNFFFEYPKNNIKDRGYIVELIVKEAKVEFIIHPVERELSYVYLSADLYYKSHLNALNAYLEEPLYSKMLDCSIDQLWRERYKPMLLNSFNGIEKFSIIRILKIIKRLCFGITMNINLFHHLLFIESHFWTINRALKQDRKKWD